ncbi:MAG: MltA domain-containing protein [Betaproteobacteria bacterium]|nr:MltA domain-containing protein [Betaproteobacteria bacterium]
MQKSYFVFLCALLLAGCVGNPLRETPVGNAVGNGASGSCEEVIEARVEVDSRECPACPICPERATVTDTAPETAARLQAAEWNDLPGWRADRLGDAWSAFLLSCDRWNPCRKAGAAATCARRRDVQDYWHEVCDKAYLVKGGHDEARRFFEAEFVPYALTEENGQSAGLVTGYFEPLIKGSRRRDAQNSIPVLGVPPDMLTIDLGGLYPDLQHRRLRGRLVGNRVVPYLSRAEIEARTDGDWPSEPILWAADPIEFFFLQIQGSGRVELPDGSHVRIGYADQNGHPYRSIGRVLIERGDLKPEEASMQGIQAWARRNPERLQELLDENPSYVFFRELTEVRADKGPLGALGVPLTAGRSIAVDPRYVTLGIPVWLATTYPNSREPLNRLVLAQDTGGAIKGVARADFFWGFGDKAGQLAGRMKQRGRMWLLMPRAFSP